MRLRFLVPLLILAGLAAGCGSTPAEVRSNISGPSVPARAIAPLPRS